MSFKAVLFNQEPDNAFGVIAPKFLVTQHSPLSLYKITATQRDLVQHHIPPSGYVFLLLHNTMFFF